MLTTCSKLNVTWMLQVWQSNH